MNVDWFLILRQNLFFLQEFIEGIIIRQNPLLLGLADHFLWFIYQRHSYLNFHFAFFTILSISQLAAFNLIKHYDLLFVLRNAVHFTRLWGVSFLGIFKHVDFLLVAHLNTNTVLLLLGLVQDFLDVSLDLLHSLLGSFVLVRAVVALVVRKVDSTIIFFVEFFSFWPLSFQWVISVSLNCGLSHFLRGCHICLGCGMVGCNFHVLGCKHFVGVPLLSLAH